MKAFLTGTLDDIFVCFPETSRPSNETRVFFIQGAAGAGKSLFCWRTMQFFDECFTVRFKGLFRLPVVITLPHLKHRVLVAPSDFLVQCIIDAYPALKNCFEHLDASSRQELFLGIPFLFFLDSVDELSDIAAINTINRLYHPGQWRDSIFVITSRSEVLDSTVIGSALPPRQFLPDGPVQPTLMSSLYLLPFSALQRDQYIAMFAKKYADLNQQWTATQYAHALEQFSEIEAFLQEPLQLFLVLSVLPILVAGKETANQDNFCGVHQCVGHAVHILYQDKDLVIAQKLATDIEQHLVAKRKGLAVFLKSVCGGASVCSRHLAKADVIIPIISASVDASTEQYLEDLVFAMNLQDAGQKLTMCPLYLAKGAEKALLQMNGISESTIRSVQALGKLQGKILKSEKDDWTHFVLEIIKLFENRKSLCEMF